MPACRTINCLAPLFALATGIPAWTLGGSEARALETGQCFAKSDQAKILSDAGQNRIVGAVTKTFLRDDQGKFHPADMKVTYTSNKAQTEGFVLIENGCKPDTVSNTSQLPNLVSVYVSMRVHVKGIFNNTLNFVPARVRSGQTKEVSEVACKRIMEKRPRVPSDSETLLPDYSHNLNEEMAQGIGSPDDCYPLNLSLDNLKSNNVGIMYQGTTVLDSGRDGLEIAVFGKFDTTSGGVFLSDSSGAAVTAETFSKILYLDQASSFMKEEQPYIPRRQ